MSGEDEDIPEEQEEEVVQESKTTRTFRRLKSCFTFKGVSLLVLVSTGVAVLCWLLSGTSEVPVVEGRWWGRAPLARDPPSALVQPLRVSFTEEMIEDLRSRLRNRRRLTPPLRGTRSEYGINTNYLNRTLDYWRDGYDFAKRELYLNKYPRFCTCIQGLRICFVHVKPKRTNIQKERILPILLLHGWPSSSREFFEVIPHLVTPGPELHLALDVVAPDLPGFGFSEAAEIKGMNTAQMSVLMRNLMNRLGYAHYIVHGGDWGSHVAAHMAILYPKEVIGLHQSVAHSDMTITYAKVLLGALWPSKAAGEYADRIYPLKDYFKYMIRETGYFHIQATKPDTIGVALTDSPVGLAGYILEKVGAVTFRNALDKEDGGIGDAYSIDDLLDMITIMWANNCVTSSMRIYAESTGPMKEDISRILLSYPIPVPSAIVKFKHEIFYYADWMLRDRYPHLVHSATYDFGGHFAAMEHPDILAKEIHKSVEAFIRRLAVNAK